MVQSDEALNTAVKLDNKKALLARLLQEAVCGTRPFVVLFSIVK